MAVHQSSVNFENLIRDLAEMYMFDVGEVVVVELIANALDAKADRISIVFDAGGRVLVVADNGRGMSAQQFEEYHDFAAGLKSRGGGIGFAGVGAKISFNIADRVITETRSESYCGGSNWYLESKKCLQWEDAQPKVLQGFGSRVEVHFREKVALPYANATDLAKLIRRHYLPLLDSKFLSLYEKLGCYSSGLRFVVNGETIEPRDTVSNLRLDFVEEFFPQKAGKRTGFGVLGLSKEEYPLGDSLCGVFLCTLGKVIKTDLFNQFPGSFGPRIVGIVEVPGFCKFLTTSKADFIRGRGAHRDFESLYGPIRDVFKSWLEKLGVESPEQIDTDDARRLEREIKGIIDEIPEFADFFGFRSRARVLVGGTGGSVEAETHEGGQPTIPDGEGNGGGGSGVLDVGNGSGEALEKKQQDKGEGTKRARPISRVARRGPKIGFVDSPERIEVAWVDGNNVVINAGHPSYIKVRSNTAMHRLHCLFSIGTAVQRFLAGDDKLVFVDRMMKALCKK